ncbi:hypothetical protein ACFV7R_44690 [Streptomyces sp. NPDC059866]|uniref:hypothetical protein n=1 Tax=Streptomyces sp. NPDC059866 TaxID=3346978 RepID=UPI003661B02F
MSDTASAIRRVYLHCEFLPADPTVRGLVSIGLTDDAGCDYYAINNGMDVSAVLDIPWMVGNGWPNLPRCTVDGYPCLLDRTHPDVKLLEEIRDDVAKYFADGSPETHLYAYYGGQHIWRLHSLWDHGRPPMPPAVPRWCHELRSLVVQAGDPPLPERAGGQHHALTDACYNRTLHEYLLSSSPPARSTTTTASAPQPPPDAAPDRQAAASPRTERVDKSSEACWGPESSSRHPGRPVTRGERLTRFPTRQMHSLVCDACDYVYDEDGDGLVVFDSPEAAAQEVLWHHWKFLSDGRVMCPSDDGEHQAMYDELMPPEPGVGG